MIAYIKNYTGVAGAVLLSFGFCYSRALASIAVILIFIQPFLELTAKGVLGKIRENKLWWWFAAYFLFVGLSFFYSNDLSKYLVQVKLLLPMVLIPTGLLAPSFYKPASRHIILGAFVVAVFSTGLASFVHYLLNFEAINEQIMHSKAVPIVTGINHIYFSILLAFAIFVSAYLAIKLKSRSKSLFWLMIGFTGCNILIIHFIAARTGLAGFYASLFLLALFCIFKSGRYVSGFSGLLGMVMLGILAIYAVPSLNNRYHNTIKDIQIHLNDGNPNYRSISTRLEAWQVTWKVFKAYPFLGVSPSDLGAHIQEGYKAVESKLMRKNRMGPHNQYLENLAALGIPGLLLLGGLLFLPLMFYLKNGDLIGLGLFAILAFAMMVESILERQTGIGFFSFFWFYWFALSQSSNSLAQKK